MKIDGSSTRLPGFEPGAPISSSRSPFSDAVGVDGSQPGHRILGNLANEALTGRGRKSGRHCLDLGGELPWQAWCRVPQIRPARRRVLKLATTSARLYYRPGGSP